MPRIAPAEREKADAAIGRHPEWTRAMFRPRFARGLFVGLTCKICGYPEDHDEHRRCPAWVATHVRLVRLPGTERSDP